MKIDGCNRTPPRPKVGAQVCLAVIMCQMLLVTILHTGPVSNTIAVITSLDDSNTVTCHSVPDYIIPTLKSASMVLIGVDLSMDVHLD